MRRLNRIVAELLAFAGLWILWDVRIAITFALVAIVIHAIQDELRAPPRPQEPPTLQDRAERP
jgi:hypothetical protein